MGRLLVVVALWLATGWQSQQKQLAFEVASIRLAKPDDRGGYIKAMPGGQEYVSRNVTVKLMISLMWKVPMRQIEGGPDWLATDGYDVDAKADGTYSLDDLHTMFQNLLAERLLLKYHKEVRQGNVYVLLLDRGGTRMKPNSEADTYGIPMMPLPGGVVQGRRVPMPYLCWWLGQQLQHDERPVIDRTGLTGNYDFTLDFDRDDLRQRGEDSVAQTKPSLFDALRDQLGLRLEPRKGPVEYLVIDAVTRPTEN